MQRILDVLQGRFLEVAQVASLLHVQELTTREQRFIRHGEPEEAVLRGHPEVLSEAGATERRQAEGRGVDLQHAEFDAVLEQGLRGWPRQGQQGLDRLGGEATVVAFLLRGQTQQGGPFGGLARGAHVRHRVDEAYGDGAAGE
ncbi:hypothetical protein EMGBD4_10110 [Verrucomicrobiota bacterium]|nr:hypothetical protein EMGBD4_10110 [Verrucomicrobiota bacterium]